MIKQILKPCLHTQASNAVTVKIQPWLLFHFFIFLQSKFYIILVHANLCYIYYMTREVQAIEGTYSGW